MDLEEKRSDEGFQIVYLFSWYCPAGVFQVNVPRCWRRGYWDEVGNEKDGEDLLIHWGWDQRGKGDQNRFSATEHGIRLGD